MYADVKYEKIEELLFNTMKPVLELKIKWPMLGGNVSRKAEENFNAFYLDNARAANKFARTELYRKACMEREEKDKSGFPFTVYSFIRKTNIEYSDKKYLSAVTETYIYTDGAHGVTTQFAKTWDIQTGNCMQLKSFFRKGFNYRKYIISSLIRQIQQMSNEERDLLYPNAEYLAAKNFAAAGWHLSGISEISVFYPEYVIAPHSSGIIRFKIPLIR